MHKAICFKIIILAFVIVSFIGQGDIPVMAADVELSKDSTLEGILKRGKLRIGLEVGYMPFEMIDQRSGLRQKEIRHGGFRKKGRQLSLIGFDIDMGIEMAKALGVRAEFVDTLWPSIIPALNLGRFDIIMSGMSVTEDRKKRVDFSEPFMWIGQTVLLNKKHHDTIKSYKDLNDPKYTVASKPATTGEAAVRKMIPNCTYQPYNTEEAGATAVLDGRADAFVYDLPFNAVFSALHGTDKIIFLDKPFTVEAIAWAIRQDDPDFLKWLNTFLADIKKDGRFEKLHHKWFKTTDWHQHVR